VNESQPLDRNFNQTCHNNGVLKSFKELSHLNISASDVLRWSSSMEQTDRYSKYLSNNSFDVGDEYICNCTNRSSFGKFCEYQFYGGSTSFNETITKRFKPFKNGVDEYGPINIGSQLHGNRPCYMTLKCDSGLMCLDWRHICDGKNQASKRAARLGPTDFSFGPAHKTHWAGWAKSFVGPARPDVFILFLLLFIKFDASH
jgi:hypothetical protein